MKRSRGYYIQVQRIGSDWKSEKIHAWAQEGHLPQEWEHVKQDEQVLSASICFTTQRTIRADKRRYLDTYSRSL